MSEDVLAKCACEGDSCTSNYIQYSIKRVVFEDLVN